MKIYWDSSALFNALASKTVFDRFDSDEHITRSHGFAEVFSHLTGRGLPMKDGTRQKVSPADAAKMLSTLAKRLSLRDLTGAECWLQLRWRTSEASKAPEFTTCCMPE